MKYAEVAPNASIFEMHCHGSSNLPEKPERIVLQNQRSKCISLSAIGKLPSISDNAI